MDTTFPGPGSVVTLHGIGQIHRVILQGAFSIGFDDLQFGPVSPATIPATVLSCGDILGRFEPPLQSGQTVKVRKNRVIPIKALLRDEVGFVVTDMDVLAAPIIQVLFTLSDAPDAVDVTDQALAAGLGTDGNEFVFSEGMWQYNLKTKNYSASGTYQFDIKSGDLGEYVIEPSCQSAFSIE